MQRSAKWANHIHWSKIVTFNNVSQFNRRAAAKRKDNSRNGCMSSTELSRRHRIHLRQWWGRRSTWVGKHSKACTHIFNTDASTTPWTPSHTGRWSSGNVSQSFTNIFHTLIVVSCLSVHVSQTLCKRPNWQHHSNVSQYREAYRKVLIAIRITISIMIIRSTPYSISRRSKLSRTQGTLLFASMRMGWCSE